MASSSSANMKIGLPGSDPAYPQAPGQHHEFVKIYFNTNLSMFKKICQGPSDRYQVKVARGAIGVITPEVAQSKLNAIVNGSAAINKLSLVPVGVKGLYVNPKLHTSVTSSEDRKDLFKIPIDARNINLDDKASVEKAHDELAMEIVQQKLNPAYIVNVPLETVKEKDLLADFPVHITGDNPDQEVVNPGINQTSAYVHTHRAFTESHVEDGWLDSINLFVWGLLYAAKIWLFIHPNFQTRFSQILKKFVNNANFPTGHASLRQSSCNWPFHHKDIFVTADWCRKQGIPIEIIVQYPGDAVYVGPNVTHQVLNVGVGFAQAVNVGGPLWRVLARNFQPCDCKGCEVIYIFPDRRFFSHVTSQPRPFHRCEVDMCEYHADTGKDLQNHTRTVHGAHGPISSFICETCNAPYVSQSNLNRHIERAHNKKPYIFHCTVCDRKLSGANRARHMKICKPKK